MLATLRRLFDKGKTQQQRRRPGEAEALNPQPIPPGRTNEELNRMRPGEAESLNPQPIPPGRTNEELNRMRPGKAESLNPQPIPPGRLKDANFVSRLMRRRGGTHG
jgi:hypothetical protein